MSEKDLIQNADETVVLNLPSEWTKERFIDKTGEIRFLKDATISEKRAIENGEIKTAPSILEEWCEDNNIAYAFPIDTNVDNGLTPVRFDKRDEIKIAALAQKMQEIERKNSETLEQKYLDKADAYEQKAAKASELGHIGEAKRYRKDAAYWKNAAFEVRSDYETLKDRLQVQSDFKENDKGEVEKSSTYSFKEVSIEDMVKNAGPSFKLNPMAACNDLINKGMQIHGELSQEETILKQHFNPKMAGCMEIFTFENNGKSLVLEYLNGEKDIEGNPMLETKIKVIDPDGQSTFLTVGHVSDHIEEIRNALEITEDTKVSRVESTAESYRMKLQMLELEKLKKIMPDHVADNPLNVKMVDQDVARAKQKEDASIIEVKIKPENILKSDKEDSFKVNLSAEVSVEIPKAALFKRGSEVVAKLTDGKLYEGIQKGVASKLSARDISDISKGLAKEDGNKVVKPSNDRATVKR